MPRADKVQSEFHPSTPALVTVCLAVISRDDVVLTLLINVEDFKKDNRIC